MSLVALLETVWVLESRYAVKRPQLCDLLDDLLSTATLRVHEAAAVRPAVVLFRSGAVELHDALITTLAASRGAKVVTLDALASKQLGMHLLA